jgi:hypothetical protein
MGDVNDELEALVENVINWHSQRYPELQSNSPSLQSLVSIRLLCERILLPVQNQFGLVKVTYGFTSANLVSLIRKKNPSGTAPELDQHAASEFNSRENQISKRSGSACDFFIKNYSMADISRFIVNNLDFDRLYFYGDNRPIHVSISDKPVRHLQIMCESSSGRRYPGKKAFGENAVILAGSL